MVLIAGAEADEAGEQNDQEVGVVCDVRMM
jgi:hypothetical protein